MELTWFKPAFMRRRILTQIKDALSSGSFSKYHGIIIWRTLRISSHLFVTNTHFPLYPPSSGNLRFYSRAPPLEIQFYVFTRYFTPERGTILLVNEALRERNVQGFSSILLTKCSFISQFRTAYICTRERS